MYKRFNEIKIFFSIIKSGQILNIIIASDSLNIAAYSGIRRFGKFVGGRLIQKFLTRKQFKKKFKKTPYSQLHAGYFLLLFEGRTNHPKHKTDSANMLLKAVNIRCRTKNLSHLLGSFEPFTKTKTQMYFNTTYIYVYVIVVHFSWTFLD